MEKVDKKTRVLLGVCIGALMVGGLIYATIRQDTYISKVALSYVGLADSFSVPKWLENDFIKYYFPDFLWALSLSCGLHIIVKPRGLRSIWCSLGAVLFGAGYEWLQFVQMVNGTGDLFDVTMYILAAFSVSLMYIKVKE